MRPLVLLVVAEFVVLVWLGAQRLSAAPLLAPLSPPPLGDSASIAGTTPLAGRTNTNEDAAHAAPDAPRSAAAAAAPRVSANDPIGIVVTVAVRNAADGSPVEGGSVSIGRDRDFRSGNGAAPGTFAIAGLQPGEWRLNVRAERFTPHEAPLVLDDRAFQSVAVELQPTVTLRVKLLDASGKPVAEQLEQQTTWGVPYVVATETPLAGDLPPTTQSRLSRFGIGEWRSYGSLGSGHQPQAMAEGYAGELRLHRAPPAFASLLLRTTLLQSQPIAPGQQELVFTVEPKDVLARHGTVRMRLLDGAGAPIVGARPNVRTAQGGGSFGKSGTDGVVLIENVVPGLGMLELHGGAEREQLYLHVRVTPGGVTDLGDLTIGAAEKIRVAVLDAAGKPAVDASVQWTELDRRQATHPLVNNRSARAEADGTFQLWGAGRRRYAVVARTEQGALGHALVDARNGAPPPCTITLGTPATVALRANVPPAAGYVVCALDAQRTPVAVATIATEYRPRSITLPRGAYTIEIHDLLTERLVRSFALDVAGEPLTIDVP
jgi:hypothetical protein